MEDDLSLQNFSNDEYNVSKYPLTSVIELSVCVKGIYIIIGGYIFIENKAYGMPFCVKCQMWVR